MTVWAAETSIAVIPKGSVLHFWKSIHAGAAKAAAEEKIKLIWDAPQKDDDRQAQIQMVQNMMSRQVSAIVLVPQDSRALQAPVQQAKKRKIPVVIVNSGLEGNDYESFVATDNFHAGEMGAQELTRILGGKGKVTVLRYFEGSDSTTKRENGFVAQIKKTPGMTLIDPVIYAGVGVEKAFQAAQNILNRNPDINGFFCPAETVCQGILRALQTIKKVGTVKFVGFDASDAMKESLRKQEVQALIVQSPFQQGYIGFKTAAKVLRGEKVEKRIEIPVLVVTKENLDDPKIQEDFINPDLEKWLK